VTEQWVQWKPIKGLPYQLYLEKLIHSKNRLFMEFKDEDKKVTVHVLFEGSAISYRNADEGDRYRTIVFLSENYGDDFYTECPFFKVKYSSYIEWFRQESYSAYNDVDHYAFITPNDIVDVLSTDAPKVSVIESI
jgi:hypothetical protein